VVLFSKGSFCSAVTASGFQACLSPGIVFTLQLWHQTFDGSSSASAALLFTSIGSRRRWARRRAWLVGLSLGLILWFWLPGRGYRPLQM